MKQIKMLQNPVLRFMDSGKINNPAGNVAEEISLQELGDQAGGWFDSPALGNQGKYCTVTKECMFICNVF